MLHLGSGPSRHQTTAHPPLHRGEGYGCIGVLLRVYSAHREVKHTKPLNPAQSISSLSAYPLFVCFRRLHLSCPASLHASDRWHVVVRHVLNSDSKHGDIQAGSSCRRLTNCGERVVLSRVTNMPTVVYSSASAIATRYSFQPSLVSTTSATPENVCWRSGIRSPNLYRLRAQVCNLPKPGIERRWKYCCSATSVRDSGELEGGLAIPSHWHKGCRSRVAYS